MKSRKNCLVTEDLVLKPLEEGGREAFLSMAQDERIMGTYMFPVLKDKAEADALFDRMKELCSSDGHFLYGIYRNGRLIGMINDCGISGDTAELGYFISPEYRNRGYASQALRTAVDELFRMGYAHVTAGYFEENAASRRVMEKCGMKPLTKEEKTVYRGKEYRCLYCGIDRTGQTH